MGACGGGDARHLSLNRSLENKTKKSHITKFNVIKTTTLAKLLAVPVPFLHPEKS
jgi:hypothetical protein